MAAIHGVYNKQNTRKDIADAVVMLVAKIPALPYKTARLATTLSFIKNPLIKDTTRRQSPRPIGANIGLIIPAKLDKMLDDASET